MTIAIISDLHDNLASWDIIVKTLAKKKIAVVLNCGDTCSLATLAHMTETFPGQLYTVAGNGDLDDLDAEALRTLPRVHNLGASGTLTLGDRLLFVAHYRQAALSAITNTSLDLACYGHDHIRHAELIGRALLLNPGTAGGVFQYPSFAIVDLKTMKPTFIDITV